MNARDSTRRPTITSWAIEQLRHVIPVLQVTADYVRPWRGGAAAGP
jgi:hypothetical protein